MNMVNSNSKMMQALIAASLFLLITPVAMADSSSCADSSTATMFLTRMNYTDSTSIVNLTWNQTCNQNCSTTLNYCRPDEPYQLLYFVLLFGAGLAFCILGLWIGDKMVMLDLPIYMVVATFFAFMGGAFDVFNSHYNTAFLGFAFVPLAFFLYSLWKNIRISKEERRLERGSGRNI